MGEKTEMDAQMWTGYASRPSITKVRFITAQGFVLQFLMCSKAKKFGQRMNKELNVYVS